MENNFSFRNWKNSFSFRKDRTSVLAETENQFVSENHLGVVIEATSDLTVAVQFNPTILITIKDGVKTVTPIKRVKNGKWVNALTGNVASNRLDAKVAAKLDEALAVYINEILVK